MANGIAEPDPPLSELALARAWADGTFPERLITREGQTVEIVYPGRWTHGIGPDFSDAMIAWPNGKLETGAIELHLRTSGWREHGHYNDPAYQSVILHVVGIDDGSETRRNDGKLVPVVSVGLERASIGGNGFDWSRVGGAVCAAELAASNSAVIVRALHGLGDERLSSLVTAFEAELALAPPDQVLWTALLDALGLTENREPMKKLATLLPIIDLERTLQRSDDRFVTALALLLGVGGFLPLSPRDAESSGLEMRTIGAAEHAWTTVARPPTERLSPGEWSLTRVRPANHPVARLVAAAALVSSGPDGFAGAMIEPVRAASFQPRQLIEAVERSGAHLGEDRAIVITSRVLIPFAVALAAQTGDTELSEGAMASWDQLLPSAHNRHTRAAQLQVTGGPGLRDLGERGMQGLIQLHRTRCLPRRCYECPIARLVVAGG
jgi:hypothetical protein